MTKLRTALDQLLPAIDCAVIVIEQTTTPSDPTDAENTSELAEALKTLRPAIPILSGVGEQCCAAVRRRVPPDGLERMLEALEAACEPLEGALGPVLAQSHQPEVAVVADRLLGALSAATAVAIDAMERPRRRLAGSSSAA